MNTDNSKKNRYRFTLQFNQHDPRHVRAVNILCKQNRSISQFIVSAVLHYMDCTKESVAAAQNDEELIASIVRQTVRELGGMQMPEPPPAPATAAQREKPAQSSSGQKKNLLSDGMSAFSHV
jgi:hypothetical protein